MSYSNEERLNLYQCYFQNNKSIALTIRAYRQKYPERRIPERSIFRRIEQDLEQHGFLKYNKRNKTRNVLDDQTQLNICLHFEEFGEKSIRDAEKDLDIARTNIHRTLQMNNYKAFKFAKLQQLEPNDYILRMDYCMLMMDRHFTDHNFFHNICWTDEAIFTTSGIFNRKNTHYWSQQNKKSFKTIQHQGRRSLHCWCAIYRNRIIGPLFLNNHLNGAGYLELLTNDIGPLLAVNGNNIHNIIYQMDGAPCHSTRLVQNYVTEHFAEIVGPNGNVRWPPRSPDLTPLDNFLWGTLKNKVYKDRPRGINDLRNRITQEIQLLNRSGAVRDALRKLEVIYTTCIAQNGRHIAHLI